MLWILLPGGPMWHKLAELANKSVIFTNEGPYVGWRFCARARQLNPQTHMDADAALRIYFCTTAMQASSRSAHGACA